MLSKPQVSKKGERSPSIADFRSEDITKYLDPHEPIGGKNKGISEKEGLYIYVAREYHSWLHHTAEGELENARLKMEMQQIWIEYNGRSLDDFIKLFGTDYEVSYEIKMRNR